MAQEAYLNVFFFLHWEINHFKKNLKKVKKKKTKKINTINELCSMQDNPMRFTFTIARFFIYNNKLVLLIFTNSLSLSV